MLGELYPFIIIVCAVVIIWSLMNKNKKLQKTAFMKYRSGRTCMYSNKTRTLIHEKGRGIFSPSSYKKFDFDC
jgi:hypothetical protein